jgi:hypothetical protein
MSRGKDSTVGGTVQDVPDEYMPYTRNIGALKAGPKSFYVKTSIQDTKTGVTKTLNALLDTGASGNFIDRKWAKECGFHMVPLPKRIQVRNADRSLNRGRDITHEVQVVVSVGEHIEKRWLDAVDLGKMPFMVLGLPWLHMHNPEIDWSKH